VLRYQHATAKRDEAIADGIDRILDADQDEGGGDVLRFRDRATGEGPGDHLRRSRAHPRP